MTALIRTVTVAILVLLQLPSVAAAQERSEDRRRYIEAGSPVSDDPRRIPVAAGPRGPEGSFVLRGGRVFDGTSAPAREATVVIERNRISGVLSPQDETWPSDAQVIDVTGQTVLPGLIDLHGHLTYLARPPGDSASAEASITDALDPAHQTLRAIERLRYYIESGITSVRDVSSHGTVPFQLKRWVRDRRLIGPRIFPSGQAITGTGGHGAERLSPFNAAYGAVIEASGPDGWREAVREQFKAGADVIKLMSHFAPDEIQAAVDEAHALGLKVAVDAETFYIRWAVEAGADDIEHPLPRSDDVIEMMAANGTAAVPTLVPYMYVFALWGGYHGATSRRFTFSHEANLEVLRKMKQAGIKIGVGADLPFNWYRLLPGAYITELKQLVAVGYTVPGALVAATRTSAEILDMDDRLGTLERGKLADVLVVDGEPDQRLEDLANVNLVIRDGELVLRNGQVVIPRHEHMPEPTSE